MNNSKDELDEEPVKVCTNCGHIKECHRENTYCKGPTGYAFGAVAFGCTCTKFEWK